MAVTAEAYVCDECDFEAKNANGLRAHKRFRHPVDEPRADGPEPTIYETPPEPEASGESPPVVRERKGILSRLRPHKTEQAPKVKVKGDAPKIRRVNTSDTLTLLYGLTGKGLEGSQLDVPVGRAMQFNAPVAGPVLDRLLARTWFDRWLLQRFSRRSKELEEAFLIVGFPFMVGLYERAPAGPIEPFLRRAVRANLIAYAPILKKMKEEEAKEAQTLELLDMGFEEGEDPITAILQGIFARPPDEEVAASNGTEPSPVAG